VDTDISDEAAILIFRIEVSLFRSVAGHVRVMGVLGTRIHVQKAKLRTTITIVFRAIYYYYLHYVPNCK
jgi:hypothetical protein